MALTAEQIAQQRREAEELLFSGPQKLGFAKALFFGHFNAQLLFPYPEIQAAERDRLDQILAEVRRFVAEKLDAAAIDRNAEIPPEVVAGLAELGVLGMTAPRKYGGQGISQLGNSRVMEIVGARCAGTAVFVNAHHSIGIRALLLFGTEQQKQRWLPGLASGRQLAAFALTETQAGSDAADGRYPVFPGVGNSGRCLHHERLRMAAEAAEPSALSEYGVLWAHLSDQDHRQRGAAD